MMSSNLSSLQRKPLPLFYAFGNGVPLFLSKGRLKRLASFLCVGAALLFALAAHAEPAAISERGTRDEAVALIKRAIEYFKANDPKKAFAEFSDTNGRFVDRDLFVVVFDENGTCLAHGYNPKLVGRNRMDEQYIDGIYSVRERVELMKTQSSFWKQYWVPDPLTHKLRMKSIYCEVAEDPARKRMLFCSGVYDVQE